MLPAMNKGNKVAASGFDNDPASEESAGEMTWPEPVFTQAMMKAQLKNKKKRVHSNSFSHSGANGLTVNGVSSDRDKLVHAMQKVRVSDRVPSARVPYSKNSKKSRNGHKNSTSKRVGKNLMRPADDMEEVELDPEDPDYDSDLNDPVFLEEVLPALSDEKFESNLNGLLKDYFSHSQTEDIIVSLQSMCPSSSQRRRLPYLCINLALQFKLRECEMTSSLLSAMYGRVLNAAQMQQGFHLVLDMLPELVIDVPKAPEFVGRFVARAVADDILPPRFIETQKSTYLSEAVAQCHQGHDHLTSRSGGLGGHSASLDDTSQSKTTEQDPASHRVTSRSNSGGDTFCTAQALPSASMRRHINAADTGRSSSGVSSVVEDESAATGNFVKQALDRAECLLFLDHAYTRLNHVWGVKVGHGANKYLVKKMKDLLREMLVSDDVAEATRCLQDLDAPHFHHELVYQAVLLVIEKCDDATRVRMARLLHHLSKTVVLTVNQLNTGIRRIYADMPEIQIDVPKAYVCLNQFMKHCQELGFMPSALMDELPAKTRKRFISEGDALHRRPEKC